MNTTRFDSKADVFVYHPADELLAMNLAQIEDIWDLVPTERQRQYTAIYERTRRNEGASGSDAIELTMIRQLLERYTQRGLVPVGAYWVPTPPQIQNIATANTEIARTELHVAAPKIPKALIVLSAACLLVFGFVLVRGISSRRSSGATVTVTATATLLHTPTPTPIALEQQDVVIHGGDTSNSSSIYPVNLRVVTDQTAQPRVFIVQRKAIQTTEWNYDDDPDTASYIAGMAVRPVIGIPFSTENAALFAAMTPGTTFVLQMNTGETQRFTFASRYTVNRSDTSAFQQSGPGLILALIGERNADTQEPTQDRIIVSADYLPDQELTRGMLAGIMLPSAVTPTPTLTATPEQRLDVQIISAEIQQEHLTIRLRIFNGRYNLAQLDSQSIWLCYGFVERPVGPHIAAQISPFAIQPGQAVDLTLTFAWHGEPYAMLGVLDEYQYAMRLGDGSLQ